MSEFPLLYKRLEAIKNLHFTAVTSFSAFETIQKLRAPNIVGQDEAKANVAAIGRYKGFFNIAEKGAYLNTLLCLAKIFVAHKDSLYLERLVNFAEQNKKSLTAEDFKEFHSDRQYIDELVTEYSGLDKSDLKSIRTKLDYAKDSISRLKTIRDQQLAHTNLSEPDDLDITFQEIADLIDLSEDVLNVLSSKHFKNLMVFSVGRDQVETDTISLVHLARLDNEHSREIGELQNQYASQYKSDLSLDSD
jgi:hypothetical protein